MAHVPGERDEHPYRSGCARRRAASIAGRAVLRRPTPHLVLAAGRDGGARSSSTFAIQLGSQRKEGCRRGWLRACGGAVVMLALATGVLSLVPGPTIVVSSPSSSSSSACSSSRRWHRVRLDRRALQPLPGPAIARVRARRQPPGRARSALVADRGVGGHRRRRLRGRRRGARASSGSASRSATTALPYLNYSARWLLDESARPTRAPARPETGYWRLSRAPARRFGPGDAAAASATPSHDRRSGRDAAQRRRRLRHRGLIVHPGGVSELYLGQVNGSADRSGDGCRHAHRHREGVRRRDPPLRSRRRPPAVGVGHRRPRARTAHPRVSDGSPVSTDLRRRPAPSASPASATSATRSASSARWPPGAAIVDLSDRDVLTVTGRDRLQLARLPDLAAPHRARAGRVRRDPAARPARTHRARGTRARRRRDHLASADRRYRRAGSSPSSTGCGSCCAWRGGRPRDPSSRPGHARGGAGRRSDHATAAGPTASRWSGATRGQRWHGGGHQYATAPPPPCGRVDLPRDPLEPTASASCAAACPAAGSLALEALRIAAWRPRAATEVDETTIPHELDWLRSAVHLTKGCYRGQETVAKVHNLGHPPRRLVMLHLDGSDGRAARPGDVVTSETSAIGRVTARPSTTSWARSRSRSSSAPPTRPPSCASRPRTASTSPPPRRSSCRRTPAPTPTSRASPASAPSAGDGLSVDHRTLMASSTAAEELPTARAPHPATARCAHGESSGVGFGPRDRADPRGRRRRLFEQYVRVERRQ